MVCTTLLVITLHEVTGQENLAPTYITPEGSVLQSDDVSPTVLGSVFPSLFNDNRAGIVMHENNTFIMINFRTYIMYIIMETNTQASGTWNVIPLLNLHQ